MTGYPDKQNKKHNTENWKDELNGLHHKNVSCSCSLYDTHRDIIVRYDKSLVSERGKTMSCQWERNDKHLVSERGTTKVLSVREERQKSCQWERNDTNPVSVRGKTKVLLVFLVFFVVFFVLLVFHLWIVSNVACGSGFSIFYCPLNSLLFSPTFIVFRIFILN
jgi:hypothetical protein